MTKRATYKTSGVDIDKANVFVESIKPYVKQTMSRNVMQRKGSFGALYGLDSSKYKEPVLVSSTDGVGTKLLLAKTLKKHDTVGIDLVAMNVNDILCTGAKPLFFLDYIACGKLDVRQLKEVVKGIVKGCRESGCSLIGGETAEMPGMYKSDEYDLAGFAVGVVDKKKLVDGSTIKAGDQLIGLASSGFHSNGYSLVRKVFSFAEQKKMAAELLAPTRIYVRPILKVLEKYKVKGMAHITGGAYYEKLTKVLPQGKCFKIHLGSWPVPKVFQILQKKGKINLPEMYRTFNMGIGFVLVAAKKDVGGIRRQLTSLKVKNYHIGEVINDRNRRVVL